MTAIPIHALRSASSNAGYLRQLDGLRAVAVGGVIWQHWLSPVYHVGTSWGFKGVWLFFVISGFLITGILLNCRNDEGLAAGVRPSRLWSIRQFYIRRFLRIFPLYYATLLVATALDAPHMHEHIGWHALYLTNVLAFVLNEHVQPAAHFWSLAVEEQFYLIWPWIIVFAPRRWLIAAMLAAILAGPLFRFGALLWWPDNSKASLLTPGCLDALGAGALLSCVAFIGQGSTAAAADRRIARTMLMIGLPGALGSAVALRLSPPSVDPWIRAIEPFGLALVFGWAVSQAAHGFPGIIGRMLEFGPLVYLGRISYGVYVIHPFVDAGLDAMLARVAHPAWLAAPGVPKFIVLLTITLALASISWYAFEAPLNRLKRHFPYRRTSPLTSA
jgi:peptidoglycan/LPS O-acetylase OafA/YrhL